MIIVMQILRREILTKILTMKRVGVLEILLLNKKEEYILKCRNKKAYQTKMEIIPKSYKKLKEKDSNNIFIIDRIIILYRISLKLNFKV